MRRRIWIGDWQKTGKKVYSLLYCYRIMHNKMHNRIRYYNLLETRKMANSDSLTVNIGGMSCQHCVGSVKNKLASLPGVTGVEVTLDPGRAIVTGQGISEAAVKSAIEEIGFDVL